MSEKSVDIQNAGKGGSFTDHLAKRLVESRAVLLVGGVDDRVASRIVTSLLVLEAEDAKKPITLYLNSPGGSVTAGFSIYDTMHFISCPVTVVATGLCASIATVIMLGAPKERRLGMPNSRYLIHQPLIPSHIFGPASDLEITAREILKTREKINALLAEECGQPIEQVKKDTQRDYWMDAERALKYGLIDRIVANRADVD